jgi:hypothetical protein
MEDGKYISFTFFDQISTEHVSQRDRSVDSPSLVSVLNIQSMCSKREEGKKIFIMVEFIYIENMKYIGRGESHYSTDLQGISIFLE